MKNKWLLYIVLIVTISGFVFACKTERNAFDSGELDRIPDTIVYSDQYDGHLQGISSDFDGSLFWSHTRQLVKTDLNGKVLKEIDVQNHHGDLDYYQGRVYVAVNFGKFNEEPGLADSWVYVYDAKDLSFKHKYAVPELVHGAGGIAINQDRVMIVGGLPEKGQSEINYVYEYNMDFHFVKRHDLKSGYTYKGIQTATWFNDRWYFACYGSDRLQVVPRVLEVRENSEGDLLFIKSYKQNMSYGMVGMKDKLFLYSCGSLNKLACKGDLQD